MRKPDAEHVESMWSLPVSGFLQAGPIAAGVIVCVGAPAGRAYSPGGGAARRQTRPAPDPASPPRGWRGPLSRSRRHGERASYPLNASVNHPVNFIFIFTVSPPPTSPPSSPGRICRDRM